MPSGNVENVQEKKIRFRPPFSSDGKNENVVTNENVDMVDETDAPKKTYTSNKSNLLSFLKLELTRDYQLANAEERFSSRRERIYSFLRIPREVERFMCYGFMQCADSLLFVFTFLPIRVVLALHGLIIRPFRHCFGFQGKKCKRVLTPPEVCDLLKAIIILFCSVVMLYVDTNMLYHLIKSQSVIKLYIFFNMLDIADRLFSAFGQDAIDALLWTAIEPRSRKREHLGTLPHLIFAIIYVILHSILVLFQATTLNVAVNSRNKALMTVMISNNFVELKGSVFKKFDKNNLFQVSCSDVRERFHLFTLLSIVILQTMKEYSWKADRFWVMVPDCICVLAAELVIDWVKHAFITRFNDLNLDVYKDYTTSLAYDVTQTRQKHAFSDHSDLVARRMGFIPLPITVVIIRVLIHSVRIEGIPSSILLGILGYICLGLFKIMNSLLILGKACDLITQHKQEKVSVNSPLTQCPNSPLAVIRNKTDHATSPSHPMTEHHLSYEQQNGKGINGKLKESKSSLLANGFPPLDIDVKKEGKDKEQPISVLSAAAIFENSNVDLKNATLNEELLKVEGEDIRLEQVTDESMTRSFPNIKSETENENDALDETLKRSESEPNLNKSECESTTN